MQWSKISSNINSIRDIYVSYHNKGSRLFPKEQSDSLKNDSLEIFRCHPQLNTRMKEWDPTFEILTLNKWYIYWDICDALRDLVPFLQFKKHEKHPWRSVNLSKVAGFTKINTTPWVFLTFSNCTNGTTSCNAPYIVSRWRLLKGKCASLHNISRIHKKYIRKVLGSFLFHWILLPRYKLNKANCRPTPICTDVLNLYGSTKNNCKVYYNRLFE